MQPAYVSETDEKRRVIFRLLECPTKMSLLVLEINSTQNEGTLVDEP